LRTGFFRRADDFALPFVFVRGAGLRVDVDAFVNVASWSMWPPVGNSAGRGRAHHGNGAGLESVHIFCEHQVAAMKSRTAGTAAADLLPTGGSDRASGCFRRHIVAGRFGIGLEHRAARRAKLRLVLPQTGDDAADVGNLAPA
jgi:hypothetical protein